MTSGRKDSIKRTIKRSWIRVVISWIGSGRPNNRLMEGYYWIVLNGCNWDCRCGKTRYGAGLSGGTIVGDGRIVSIVRDISSAPRFIEQSKESRVLLKIQIILRLFVDTCLEIVLSAVV